MSQHGFSDGDVFVVSVVVFWNIPDLFSNKNFLVFEIKAVKLAFGTECATIFEQHSICKDILLDFAPTTIFFFSNSAGELHSFEVAICNTDSVS